MKLADVEVEELVRALGMERSAWIDVASKENRRHTEPERVTICVLGALERALARLNSVAMED
jgi:hypothetical protein